MSNNLLSVKHISKTFNANSTQERKSLIDVSFDLNQGDFGVIVGGNGAGKSTLMNVISGKILADEGSIILGNEDLTKLSEYKRAAKISRVHQNPALGTAPRMSIVQNLAIAYRRGKSRGLRASIKSEDISIYKEHLKELGLGLEDRMETPMELLSGGQRQAVALVMATLSESKLLLLDEHTAALDPHTQKLVMSLTDTLVKRYKLTALMITHSLSDAIKYGNKLFILEEGKLKHKLDYEEKKSLTAEKLFILMENNN